MMNKVKFYASILCSFVPSVECCTNLIQDIFSDLLLCSSEQTECSHMIQLMNMRIIDDEIGIFRSVEFWYMVTITKFN